MADPYKTGLEHIRAGRFFEAHEELELAWRAVFGGRQHRRRKVYDDCKCDRGQSFKHLR